jgi:oxygen-independent coproporphyrinogen III oxidase
MTTPGLYIHIPFCEKKCGYCNFFSVTSREDVPEFVKALLDEISLYKNDYSTFDSIYIGGGTPSILPAHDLAEILAHTRRSFVIPADTEITVEVNPADVHLKYLNFLRQAGVNRLNMGVQSFDGQVLAFLGRRHSVAQAVDAVVKARSNGFDNIGLDLIYGVPGQSGLSWRDTLSKALRLRPEHLSCYQLTLEAGTPLGDRLLRGEFSLPGEDEAADLFLMTADVLEEAGYVHYEVSNFALDAAWTSRHNQKYWHHVPYLGIGPAAHSFKDNRRWWNHRSLKRYIDDLRSGMRPVADSETLTPNQRSLEACMLGLRTKAGIPLPYFTEHDQENQSRNHGKLLEKLVRDGLILIGDGFLKPTRRGLAVADRLALTIASEQAGQDGGGPFI